MIPKIRYQLYLAFKKIESRLLFRRKMKILFSYKPDWHDSIKKGFRFTGHEITFGELSPGKLKDYDLVVPLTIPDLKHLSECRELIADNPIPTPSMQSILLCDDKYRFNQTLTATGFGDYIPKMGTALARPYILKKSIDEWGENSHIISNEEQEQTYARAMADPNYFCQELIAGSREYATHVIFDGKKIVSSIEIEYTFETETPIKGQDQPIYKKIKACSYLDLFSSILSSVGFEGLCCINYKVRDNRPLIFEINPRFGGSLGPLFFSMLRDVVR